MIDFRLLNRRGPDGVQPARSSKARELLIGAGAFLAGDQQHALARRELRSLGKRRRVLGRIQITISRPDTLSIFHGVMCQEPVRIYCRTSVFHTASRPRDRRTKPGIHLCKANVAYRLMLDVQQMQEKARATVTN